MISRELKRVIRKDKEAYYLGICIEMEKEHSKGRSRVAYMKIKEIKRRFQPRTGILKNAKVTMWTEPEEIKNQWKEYTEQLYQNNLSVQGL